MALGGALPIETTQQIFLRVYRELRPHARVPRVTIEFRRFANADSHIRLDDGRLTAGITDALDGAPAYVIEALAHILISKLARKAVAKSYQERYRRYLNGREMRRHLHLLRQTRGRKLFLDARGACYDLEEIFEDLNFRFFYGLMARPALGWSRKPSRVMLGHYDPPHNAIVLSSLLDRPVVPRLAVEFVMYHEILHLRYPEEHRGARRCVHTREFKEAEKQFPQLKEAREMLKKL